MGHEDKHEHQRRERGRDGETEREGGTERERDGKTERERDGETERESEREIQREGERDDETEREREREKVKQRVPLRSSESIDATELEMLIKAWTDTWETNCLELLVSINTFFSSLLLLWVSTYI